MTQVMQALCNFELLAHSDLPSQGIHRVSDVPLQMLHHMQGGVVTDSPVHFELGVIEAAQIHDPAMQQGISSARLGAQCTWCSAQHKSHPIISIAGVKVCGEQLHACSPSHCINLKLHIPAAPRALSACPKALEEQRIQHNEEHSCPVLLSGRTQHADTQEVVGWGSEGIGCQKKKKH